MMKSMSGYFPGNFPGWIAVHRMGGITLLAGLLTCFFSARTVVANITSVQTTTSNGETLLSSIGFNDSRGTVNQSQLIGIQLFHYRSTPNDFIGGTTNIVSPVAPTPAGLPPPLQQLQSPSPNNRNILLVDSTLNTGIINIAAGPRISPGAQPTLATFGLGIQFLQPVINGPGDDVVFFDFANSADNQSEAFFVSALVGGVNGYSSVSSLALEIDQYMISFTGDPTYVYKQEGSLAALNDLETKPIRFQQGASTPTIAAVSFDLSDMLIPEGSSVTGLFIQSAIAGKLVDPVFIAGLHPVPEPSSIASLLSAVATLGGALARRRRTR